MVEGQVGMEECLKHAVQIYWYSCNPCTHICKSKQKKNCCARQFQTSGKHSEWKISQNCWSVKVCRDPQQEWFDKDSHVYLTSFFYPSWKTWQLLYKAVNKHGKAARLRNCVYFASRHWYSINKHFSMAHYRNAERLFFFLFFWNRYMNHDYDWEKKIPL